MTSSKQKKNFFSIIFKLLYYLVLSLICLIVIFLLYYIISSQLHADDENYKPRFSIYTIVSPSMTPVINVYDVVVNTRVDSPQDIQVGDIITYKSQAATSEGMTITHRVTEVSQLPDGTYEYMTQGDNNSEPDSLYVTYDTVIGKEIIIIPYLGRLQFLIANQKGWLFLLLIPVSIYLIKEIFTLIDLFGLRKKVDKVVGTTEDNIIEKKKIEKIKEEERKALIKEELRNKEIKKDSKLRNPEEPEGFLERYTETIITVKSNKYEKNKKTVKKEELEIEIAPDEKIDIPTSVKASNVKENERPTTEEIILPSLVDKKTNVNEQYEILDTDELTTKIKEYDSKIEQLDKMIKDMEVLEQQPKKEQTINELEEVDNFLIGTKLKVTKIEPTKNQHKNKTEKEKKVSVKKKELNIELSDIVSKNNKNSTIIIPVKKEVSETKTDKKATSSNKNNKDKLNLNPKDIKKINRPNKKKVQKSESEVKGKTDKLNLNPKDIKKINRPSKKKNQSSSDTKNKTKDNKKKTTTKKPLIVVEKRK